VIEVIFCADDGTETAITAEPGTSLMDAAVDNAIEGVVGDCGGSMTCATCHVFVADIAGATLPPIETAEDEVLDSTATPRRSNSRLSCQIELTDSMSTIRVTLPKSQW